MVCPYFVAALLAPVLLVFFIYMVYFHQYGPRQKAYGCVVITGADSGMGMVGAKYLSEKGYTVYAGVFNAEESTPKYADYANVHCFPLDVTKEESVRAAAELVRRQSAQQPVGVVALINCAGVGYNGPAEYFPLHQFRHQLEVNLVGYVACAQAFLPLIHETVGTLQDPDRRGRVLFVGTGGGVPSPSPALLSAYMASKWGVEAFCQSLRLEMRLTKKPVDVCMINPGFIKPTQLMAVGKQLMKKTIDAMPKQAMEEYGHLVDAFLEFSEKQPGTHPRHIGFAMEEALAAYRPSLRYKVGFDSKASPIVGLLPTSWREWVLAKSMFNVSL